MVKVYCYSKCSTCKKALKWMEDNRIGHTVIDIKDDHPDEKTLRELHKKSGLPLKRFFNTSGMLYKEMKLKDKLPEMTEDEQKVSEKEVQDLVDKYVKNLDLLAADKSKEIMSV